jgi:hypothetical protein
VCVETFAGYWARVYCTGLLRTGLLSYVSRKEVAETSLVRVRVRSTVPVYTLLYVSRGWADSKNTAVFMDDGHGVQLEALSEA